MIGSTTPCAAEAGFRPLRIPPAHYAEPARPAAGPGEAEQRAYPQIESHPRREAFAMTLPRSLAARLRAFAPDDKELGLFLDDLALAVRTETGSGYDMSDSARFEAGLPLEPQVASPASQAHMQALVHDFRRRQRQASMIVAGCVATSFVLAVVGIAALASFVKPAPADAEPMIKSSNADVLQQDAEPAKLILAKAAPFTDRLPVEDEDTASLVPDLGAPPASAVNAAPQLIMVQAGRPLELAPLLSQRQARYVLLRGLPNEATLSAGQRNPSGAWLVKDKDVDRLTVTMQSTASGDYPIEVYALGASSAPQARQRLVFRVAAGPTCGRGDRRVWCSVQHGAARHGAGATCRNESLAADDTRHAPARRRRHCRRAASVHASCRAGRKRSRLRARAHIRWRSSVGAWREGRRRRPDTRRGLV